MTTATGQQLTPLPLMQLATGFWASKALFAAHELGLFTLLSRRDGGTAAQVAADLEIADVQGLADRSHHQRDPPRVRYSRGYRAVPPQDGLSCK